MISSLSMLFSFREGVFYVDLLQFWIESVCLPAHAVFLRSYLGRKLQLIHIHHELHQRIACLTYCILYFVKRTAALTGETSCPNSPPC
jgi:hypothetical protein